MKVLVTGGATRERIDDVRFITNFSSGKTASTICDYLIERGHDITYCHGLDSVLPRLKCKLFPFEGFIHLEKLLQNELDKKDYNAIIHLSAVSDYSVESIEMQGKQYSPSDVHKFDSSTSMILRLKRNHKIIDNLKNYDPSLLVVGFKLTSHATPFEQDEAIQKVLRSGQVDYVVQNDLSQISESHHFSKIYNAKKEIVAISKNKTELAKNLDLILKEKKYDFVP